MIRFKKVLRVTLYVTSPSTTKFTNAQAAALARQRMRGAAWVGGPTVERVTANVVDSDATIIAPKGKKP